ncbi:MAG TPA: flavodoxin family protein [Gemmataceae bacterium]|nr:flavodoxin family protein [Gemmataceae bacterium]
MGKVLVLYHSLSGNTAKMARLVVEGAELIPGTEVRVREVESATPADIYWCDGLAVGSPTNMGVLSWQMKRFWDEAMFHHWGKVDGKLACAFSSSGGWGGGAEIACQSIQMVLMNFGFLVFGVTDYAGKTMTCHYGAIAAKEPRDADVQQSCRLLGRRLAEWVAVVADGRKNEHPLAKPELRTLPG